MPLSEANLLTISQRGCGPRVDVIRAPTLSLLSSAIEIFSDSSLSTTYDGVW